MRILRHPLYRRLTRKLVTEITSGNAVEIPSWLLWFLHAGPWGRRPYIRPVLNSVEEARYDVELDL